MAIAYTPELTGSIGVTDLAASIAWYESVLGFTLLYKVDEIAWCELATKVPGVNVGMSQVDSVAHGGGAVNVFGVVDIDDAKTHLESHGVRIDGEIQTIEGMVRLLTFFDPDGNAMMLSQNLMPQA